MKLLPIFLVVVGLVGGGIGLITTSNQVGKVPSREEVSSAVRKQLLGLKSAGLKEVDCKSIDGAAVIDGSHCYFSALEPDKLLPLIQKAMEPIGITNGWSNDYAVWGAFYATKADPKRSFGVNISPVEGDRNFEGVEAARGFRGFVDFVVNSGRKP